MARTEKAVGKIATLTAMPLSVWEVPTPEEWLMRSPH